MRASDWRSRRELIEKRFPRRFCQDPHFSYCIPRANLCEPRKTVWELLSNPSLFGELTLYWSRPAESVVDGWQVGKDYLIG